MIKAVIFDLDDTLMPERDYVISGFKSCADLLSVKGRSICETVDMLIELFDQNPKDVFNRFINSQKLPSSLIIKCIDIYRNHKPVLTLREESKVILNWLKNENIVLGLLTDGRPIGQWAKIKALGLECYMDSIVVTDELGGTEFRKPNPAGYKQIIKSLGVLPEHTAYVGDNAGKDFVAPNLMGMISVFYDNTDSLYAHCSAPSDGEPQNIIKSLTELKTLITGQVL